MAFAMPPPDSPSGTGFCVKKARFNEFAPLYTKYTKIAMRGTITRAVASIANPLTA